MKQIREEAVKIELRAPIYLGLVVHMESLYAIKFFHLGTFDSSWPHQ